MAFSCAWIGESIQATAMDDSKYRSRNFPTYHHAPGDAEDQEEQEGGEQKSLAGSEKGVILG